jgi:hypothetical protein
MLLDHPWLKDVKVFHDWGNNIIIIKGIGTSITILVITKFRTPIKQPKALVCYNFHFGIFDEEENLMFTIEPKLFSIGTITILKIAKL